MRTPHLMKPGTAVVTRTAPARAMAVPIMDLPCHRSTHLGRLSFLVFCLLFFSMTRSYGATLSVALSGSGQGSVNSAPTGIACPGTCSGAFTTAILYANPATTSYFSGWGGACVGLETCSLTLTGDATVNAFFELKPAQIRVGGSNYGALQWAYGAIANNGKVLVAARDQSGNLSLDKDICCTMEGGYDDAFTASAGRTKLYGTILIKGGCLKASRLALGPPVTATPPAAPTGLVAVAGDGLVTISWTAVSGASGYNVYYATATGVTRTTGTQVTGAVSGQSITGLTNGVTYYFVVTALNASGESVESSQVIIAPVHLGPATPTGVATTPGNGQVTISWDAVAGAGSYNIYWSTSTGVTTANGTKISTIAASPYQHTGLTNGTTYYYIVTASSGTEESAPSPEVTAKPLAPTVILRLTKMSIYGTADQLMSYMTYEYDGAGRMTKSSNYGATGEISSYQVYEYNVDGNVIKLSTYIIGDVLTGYVTTEYNADGKVTKVSTYIAYGSYTFLTGYIINEYDNAGNLFKTSTCGPTGLVNEYTVYEYNAAGDVTKETTFIAGEYNNYTTYEYNAAGKIIKESEYDIDSNLAKYTTTEYDTAGRMVRVTVYNGFTDLVTKSSTYEYDSANRLIKTSTFDFAGNCTGYTTVEYNDAGKKGKVSVYDDTGLLKQYTVFEYGS